MNMTINMNMGKDMGIDMDVDTKNPEDAYKKKL
jgi:hypothetical protein